MEEEHSTSSNSHRLQIRRNILRQTTTLRSSPYNSTLSNIRRRQASQTINNLLTNIEHEDIQSEIIPNNILVTSDDENENENFEVLVDYSNTNHEQNQSYHSLSTIDFDPDDEEDDDDYYYYTSTSIPVLDYSPSPEPLIIHNNPIEIPDDEYSSSINNNNLNDDEDLSVEIMLETSQNNPLSPTPRRRRSIISSNIRNSHGLPLSHILNIPQKLYNSLEKYSQTQCYICLEDFQSIDLIKILNCQHIFHAGCINQWLRSHSNCAYCRTTISRSSSSTGYRQRTHARRNNNLFQQIPIESSIIDQQQP